VNFDSVLPALITAAKNAGSKIMEVHTRGTSAQHKADGSPVTEADQAAEAIIIPVLQNLDPEIPIISEENSASHKVKPSTLFWLVDPLDGTKEFLKTDSQGAFTVNIALIRHSMPVLGVVYAPALNRLFFGHSETAYTIDSGGERKISVRETPNTGPVAVASVSHRDKDTNAWLSARNIKQTRAIGSSLKFCLLAAGEADVYPRFGPTMEWDTAAGDAILRAAGGTVKTTKGSHYLYGKPEYKNTAFIACGGYHE